MKHRAHNERGPSSSWPYVGGNGTGSTTDVVNGLCHVGAGFGELVTTRSPICTICTNQY